MFEIFTRLADIAAYDVLSLSADSRLGAAVHFFVEDTAKIFFLLVAIIFVMGLFRSVLSPEKVRVILEGKPRGLTYGLAVLLGAVTPFCSCSSVPLFIGFLEAGIPLGATMAFLIASPMINEVAVVILGGVVGWDIAALYVATGAGDRRVWRLVGGPLSHGPPCRGLRLEDTHGASGCSGYRHYIARPHQLCRR